MVETYFVGVYWQARRETAAECARRASRFFQELARSDSSFIQWYQSGQGRPPRGQPGFLLCTDDLPALEDFMLRGRNRDSGRHVIEELGFSGSLWNGRKNSALVSIRCGCYDAGLGNVCVMSLPSEGEVFERLVSASVLAQVLTCMVTAWEPDWGVATSHALRERVSPKGHAGTFAGWLNYFSHRRGTVPPLPVPARIEPVGSAGTLVTLSPERLTSNNPEHVELLTRVQRLLDMAGLLRLVAG